MSGVFRLAGPAALLLALGAAAEVEDAELRLGRGDVLIRSEPVEGSKLPRIFASGVVDAPPERVWSIIDRCADYTRTMIHIRESHELERSGTRVLCRLTVDLPFPFSDLTSTTEAQHLVLPGQRYERSWKLLEGPYKDNSGRWLLTPFDGSGTRTLVLYEMHAEPEVRLPGWIQRIATRKTIPELFEKLRDGVRAP